MSLVWGWSLPATEKLVALKLADCADDRGLNSFPAVATIAADCGVTARGARKVLGRLRERGCIEIQAPATNRKSTTYRVVLSYARPERGSGLEGNVVPVGAERGSGPERNVVPVQGGTTFRVEGNDVPVREERGSGLGGNVVQPIRQGSVRDPSGYPTRAREGFAGTRLRVSPRQHALVIAELGSAAAAFDWPALYAAWDAQLCASGEPIDTLTFVKHAAHAQLASVQLAAHGTLSAKTHELLDECQRLHGGSCGGSVNHHTRMLLDTEKAKAVVA